MYVHCFLCFLSASPANLKDHNIFTFAVILDAFTTLFTYLLCSISPVEVEVEASLITQANADSSDLKIFAFQQP